MNQPFTAPNIPSTKSHVPFPLLRSYQSIGPGPSLTVWTFRNKTRFYDEELLAPCPNHKLEDHTFSAVRDCLFNMFYSPHWRTFLHPQPEDAPCRVDRGPFIMSQDPHPHKVTIYQCPFFTFRYLLSSTLTYSNNLSYVLSSYSGTYQVPHLHKITTWNMFFTLFRYLPSSTST